MGSDDPPGRARDLLRTLSGAHFDFGGKSIFTRYDRCEFVKCTLLIDHATEQLAFTTCVFKDCNIDKLQSDEARGLYAKDNFFDRPLEETTGRIRDQTGPSSDRRKATEIEGLCVCFGGFSKLMRSVDADASYFRLAFTLAMVERPRALLGQPGW